MTEVTFNQKTPKAVAKELSEEFDLTELDVRDGNTVYASWPAVSRRLREVLGLSWSLDITEGPNFIDGNKLPSSDTYQVWVKVKVTLIPDQPEHERREFEGIGAVSMNPMMGPMDWAKGARSDAVKVALNHLIGTYLYDDDARPSPQEVKNAGGGEAPQPGSIGGPQQGRNQSQGQGQVRKQQQQGQPRGGQDQPGTQEPATSDQVRSLLEHELARAHVIEGVPKDELVVNPTFYKNKARDHLTEWLNVDSLEDLNKGRAGAYLQEHYKSNQQIVEVRDELVDRGVRDAG